jgi:DNA helicase HerA-like ATPase
MGDQPEGGTYPVTRDNEGVHGHILLPLDSFRNQGIPFGINESDRLSHMYVIGRTGTGKSTLLETLMRQDIAQGKGMALLDPHGDLAEKIVGAVPDRRKEDLVYFNAPDPAQPYGYNPLKRVVKDKSPLLLRGSSKS